MTLYEINEAIENCFREEIDPETGEIITEVLDEEALEQLAMAKGEKIENIACLVKNLDSDVEALKQEENKLAKRRKVRENRSKRLKEFLIFACNGEKYKGVRADVGFRKSTSVVIDDIDKIPDKYVRVSTTYEPDKQILKKVLSTEDVPGAHLETKTSTIVR